MNRYAIVSILALAGCSGDLSPRVAEGQLFCAKAGAVAPVVVALADQSGVPVTVTGKAESIVAAACAVIGVIPVMPPENHDAAPKVAAAVDDAARER